MMPIKEKLLLKLNPKALIERSEYFDEDWYFEKYGIKKGADHYLNTGWKEGFDPSMRFSSKDYLINNPDIQDMNPLLHYEVYGKKEGRRPFAVKSQIVNHYETGKSDLPYELYEKTILEKKIVSFDVFDTLVIRPVLKAEEVFDYLALDSGLKDFCSARKKAEEEARKVLQKEVNIDEIYEFIDEKYKGMKEKEIEIEILFCHVNPLLKKVYDFAKSQNKKVIAVSDMYLGKDVIETILKKNGYEMDAVYVSCDLRMTKGSGKLFEHVLQSEGISSKQMVHFGDNYISDYSEPLQHGIDAFQTPKIADVMFENKDSSYTLSYFQRHNELPSSILLSALSEHLCANKEEAFFVRLGYCLGGPLAYAYLNFVCDRAKELGIECLLFVARDGFCLQKIYEKYFFDEYQIPFAYAYLSRASIYSGALENKLCENKSKILSIAERYGIDVCADEDSSKTEQTFEREEERLKQWSKIQSENLRKHLETISEGSNDIAIIDMFSGAYTSLKGALYYLPSKNVTGFFAGNFAKSDLKHESFAKRLLGMGDNLCVKMSEFLITSYESPIIGVDEELNAIYEKTEDEKRRVRFDQIQKGIENYIDDQRRFFTKKKEYHLSLEEWIDLSDSFLRECSDEDLEKLREVLDSENPVSGNHDPSFADLIQRYRDTGY